MELVRLAIGEFPGLDGIMCQYGLVWVIKPPYNTGTSPQYIKLDLPLPEYPITVTDRYSESFKSISSTWPSRPKNRCDSSSAKGRRPGNGLNRGWLADKLTSED